MADRSKAQEKKEQQKALLDRAFERMVGSQLSALQAKESQTLTEEDEERYRATLAAEREAAEKKKRKVLSAEAMELARKGLSGQVVAMMAEADGEGSDDDDRDRKSSSSKKRSKKSSRSSSRRKSSSSRGRSKKKKSSSRDRRKRSRSYSSDSYSSDSSRSDYSSSSSSYSSGGSYSSSDDDDGSRRKRKSKKSKRHRKSSKESRKRKHKHSRHSSKSDRKRDRKKSRRGRADDDSGRGEKDRKDKGAAAAMSSSSGTGNLTAQFGKYGIVRQSDFTGNNQKIRRSFEMWLVEVKGIASFNGPKGELLSYFSEYAEDFNTATLPHVKYYDYDKWEMEDYNQRKKEAEDVAAVGGGSKARSDEFQHREEMKRREEEKRRAEVELMRATVSAKREEMKGQALLKAELENAYKTGDQEKIRSLKRRLEPEERR